MGRKKNDEIPKSDFEVNEAQDLLSFDSNENLGECVATFSFGNANNQPSSTNINDINNASDNALQSLFDNRTTPIANGAAPLIKGEIPDVKRTYMLRASTVRKLNELKSIHPNINVCVSTIVDLALDYYHKHIKEDGVQ